MFIGTGISCVWSTRLRMYLRQAIKLGICVIVIGAIAGVAIAYEASR